MEAWALALGSWSSLYEPAVGWAANVKAAPLAGIAAAAGLTSDNLLGEMNQHPLASLVLQFAKRPQQAQIKQRLQRTAALLRRMILPGFCGASNEIRRKAEHVGDLQQPPSRGP